MIVLDTCALLWLAIEPAQLSERARTLITANRGALAVSAISAFEIAVKCRKQKLELSLPPDQWWHTALVHHGIASIPVSDDIALASVLLPPHHNDPADRMIIATAARMNAPVITTDAAFGAYGMVRVEW